MIHIGIDIGKKGCICVRAGKTIGFYDIPMKDVIKNKKKKKDYDIDGIVEILKNTRNLPRDPGEQVHACMESLHSMPSQGVASMFSFGEGYGIMQGVLTALNIPFIKVTPQKWKAELMADLPKEKESSLIAAVKFYPEVESMLYGPNGGAKHDRADAILLSRFLELHPELKRQ